MGEWTMSTLTDWSIKSKSAVTLGLLSGLVLLLGLISFFLLSSTNGQTEQLATNWMPSLRVAGEIRTTVVRMRAAEARIAMTDSAESYEIGLKGYGNFEKSVQEQIDRYKRELVANDEDRQSILAVEAELGKYREAVAATMALAQKLDRLAAEKSYLGNQKIYQPVMA